MKALYDSRMWKPGDTVDTPCDEWTTSLDKKGYGRITIDYRLRRTFLVHRIVWMQTHGHTDLDIIHICDNPSCIRLDHLHAATRAENNADMKAKGRMSKPPAWSGTPAQLASAKAMARRKAEENAKKTHCPHGHPYSGNNLIRRSGKRFCRACRDASNAKRRIAATIAATGQAS